MSGRLPRLARGPAFDVAVFLAGASIAVAGLVRWLPHASLSAVVVIAPILVIVLSSIPLVISQRNGDVVIGFESVVLVYLALTGAAVQAEALWAIGTIPAHVVARKSWRTRLFNVGVTNLSGPVALVLLRHGSNDSHEFVAVLLLVGAACAAYFLVDLLITAVSLVADGTGTLLDSVPLRSIPLPLACFVGIDTLGYLGALMTGTLPSQTLFLLFVPIGTILVAARAVSQARLHELRMSGLFAAATFAARLPDDAGLDAALVAQAEQVLRHCTAELREAPAVGREIGVPLSIEGQPTRHLVVRRDGGGSGAYFDGDDLRALEALAAVVTESLERRRLGDEMAYLARHDPLTGLANRTLLTDRLSHAMALLARSQRTVGVLYLDLDGFKGVNDRFGHHAGDRILGLAAERLRACTREADTLARLGGDEFAVLLEDVSGDDEVLNVAGRVLTSLAQPFEQGAAEIRIGASIGVAFAHDAEDSADLLRNADLALYRAKTLGRGRIELFDPQLRTASLQRLELEEELRRAFDADLGFDVHYQPMVNLVSGQITGFEALARWQHPQLGRIPPDVFVPLAEQIGLIRPLGERILRQALADGSRLSAAANHPVDMAVNVSATQLTAPGFPELVTALVADNDQVQLVVELTEGTLLGDDEVTATAITALCDAGVQLAVDDFGVGYSSISYLHRLPVDSLKIDRSFIQRLPGDTRAAALVEAVAAMADALGITLVAEGIENAAAASFVRTLGCRLGQGFFFSAAVPLAEALDLSGQHVDLSGLDVVRAVPSQERRRRRAARG